MVDNSQGKYKRGPSLGVQWLGLQASTARVGVQSLSGELRFCRLKKKPNRKETGKVQGNSSELRICAFRWKEYFVFY